MIDKIFGKLKVLEEVEEILSSFKSKV